jgi:hypothetical protein
MSNTQSINKLIDYATYLKVSDTPHGVSTSAFYTANPGYLIPDSNNLIEPFFLTQIRGEIKKLFVNGEYV